MVIDKKKQKRQQLADLLIVQSFIIQSAADQQFCILAQTG